MQHGVPQPVFCSKYHAGLQSVGFLSHVEKLLLSSHLTQCGPGNEGASSQGH